MNGRIIALASWEAGLRILKDWLCLKGGSSMEVRRAIHPIVTLLRAKPKKRKLQYTHMIRPFLTLLLVPLMLANQGLCFAHSHHDTNIVESEGHASRSHFHTGDHDHESKNDHADHSQRQHSDRTPSSEHDGGDHPTLIQSSTDHDADAVYSPEAATLAHFRQTVIIDLPLGLVSSAIVQTTHHDGNWLLLRGQPTSVFDTACPIYLRTLSLRI
jgi:hypothetical protein